MNTFFEALAIVLATILVVIAMAAFTALFYGVFVMLLWDWIMPTIFGLPTITYLQACGLTALLTILFRGSVQSKQCEK